MKRKATVMTANSPMTFATLVRLCAKENDKIDEGNPTKLLGGGGEEIGVALRYSVDETRQALDCTFELNSVELDPI